MSRQYPEVARLAISFTLNSRCVTATFISFPPFIAWTRSGTSTSPTSLWFRDGLDPEERAYISALKAVMEVTFEDRYESRFTQSATIELPLAGEVGLWAFQHEPFAAEADLLAIMEEGVRGAEEFMGLPFPVNDVIVLSIIVLSIKEEKGGLLRDFWGLPESTKILM